jgi:hypothetical protein
MSCSNAAPSAPRSRKPAETITAAATPAAAQSSITAATAAAGDYDDGEIDIAANCGDALTCGKPEHGLSIEVHGVHGAGEAAANQVVEDDVAEFARVMRCADERDAARVEERIERAPHVTPLMRAQSLLMLPGIALRASSHTMLDSSHAVRTANVKSDRLHRPHVAGRHLGRGRSDTERSRLSA